MVFKGIVERFFYDINVVCLNCSFKVLENCENKMSEIGRLKCLFGF